MVPYIRGMAGSVFVVVLPVGAALLAGWLDWRFEARRPESPVLRVGHGIAAAFVLELATRVLVHFAAAPLVGEMAVLFLIFLPSLVYAFLSALWIVRTLTDVAKLARR